MHNSHPATQTGPTPVRPEGAQRDAHISARPLTSLPERLGELKTLQTLRLEGCSGLVTLPDLSGLAQLETEGLPVHLQPWEDSGYKAGTFSSESRPSSPPADVMEMGLTEMGLIRLRQLTAKAYAPSGYKAFSPLQTRRDCPR